MRGKKGFEFSFSWIFAIIVGAMIISLAVFAAVRAVNVGKTATETSLAKQFTVILEPFETKLASSKNPAPLQLNDEVIFFNKCINDTITQTLNEVEKKIRKFMKPRCIATTKEILQIIKELRK